MSKIFETKNTATLSRGLRITLTMEACSEDGMKWALAQGLKFASGGWA